MSPLSIPAGVLAEARRTTRELTAATGIDIDAEETLGGRAALLGLAPNGAVSAGGAARLMKASDGWCALSLARPDDVDAVPALVEADVSTADPWPAVREYAHRSSVQTLADRARLLGLPVGVLGETTPAAPAVRAVGRAAPPRPLHDLLVVDLTSMWAGPLCGRLLAGAGATVVKVESRRRPDGTRNGSPQFFDWVNSGKLSYAAAFDRPAGLRRLLSVADVVLESSRPAALRSRGLGPDDVPARDGRIWLQITGHGVHGDRAHWVAFGDDAAVSGGLVRGTPEAPAFCGDAIADPLTGLDAARAVMDSHARGGGEVIGVAMAAVAARYAQLPNSGDAVLTKPLSPVPPAAELGRHNELVDRMARDRLATPC
ncbi:MAG: CoA transferase [Actinomycetota bacterium]